MSAVPAAPRTSSPNTKYKGRTIVASLPAVVALLPPPRLEAGRADQVPAGTDAEQQQGDQVRPERNHVAPDQQPVLDVRVRRIPFGIDAQIVLAGRHSWNQDAGTARSFAPRSVLIDARIAADLARHVQCRAGLRV